MGVIRGSVPAIQRRAWICIILTIPLDMRLPYGSLWNTRMVHIALLCLNSDPNPELIRPGFVSCPPKLYGVLFTASCIVESRKSGEVSTRECHSTTYRSRESVGCEVCLYMDPHIVGVRKLCNPDDIPSPRTTLVERDPVRRQVTGMRAQRGFRLIGDRSAINGSVWIGICFDAERLFDMRKKSSQISASVGLWPRLRRGTWSPVLCLVRSYVPAAFRPTHDICTCHPLSEAMQLRIGLAGLTAPRRCRGPALPILSSASYEAT